jgi:hypothetical protein
MGWVTKTNKPTGTGNIEMTDKIMALYRKPLHEFKISRILSTSIFSYKFGKYCSYSISVAGSRPTTFKHLKYCSVAYNYFLIKLKFV